MSIQVSWDNPEFTVIHYAFGVGWDWHDFQEATSTSNHMIRNLDHDVDLIADFTEGSAPPMGALSQFKSAYENAPANAGTVVVVSRNIIIRSLVSMFGALYQAWGHKIMVADTVEEARSKITRMRNQNV